MDSGEAKIQMRENFTSHWRLMLAMELLQLDGLI